MQLDVKNLSYTICNHFLFRNLSFSIKQGQSWLLQGPNGSGKSTLLKILTGLILPAKGLVHWRGQNIIQNRIEYYADLSYLGHKDGLKRALTPVENIFESITQPHRNRQDLDNILDQLQLKSYQHTTCDNLSAGQRRKVALAAIVMQEKPLWILDEPLNSLDVLSTQVFADFVQHHVAKGGMVIMASHTGLATPHIIDLSLKGLC